MTLRVLRAGPLTTVQDRGRSGHRAAGVPASGAMDPWAAEAANRLVGNAPTAALLEVTLAGPELVFDVPTTVAATGSRGELAVDGRSAGWNTAHRVAAGEAVALGRLFEGARAYLAIVGGVTVAPVLGSRATYLRGGFGGWAGRALAAGDEIEIGGEGEGSHERQGGGAPLGARPAEVRAQRLERALFSPRHGEIEVRALVGPQYAAFAAASQDLFFTSEWRLDSRSDRVGLRLLGPPLAHRASAEIWPEGLLAGGVQVPAEGLPIVLGPDSPTTGSYAKIATVIAADLGALAHLRPGDRLRFRRCELDAARRALDARRADLEEAFAESADDDAFDPVGAPPRSS